MNQQLSWHNPPRGELPLGRRERSVPTPTMRRGGCLRRLMFMAGAVVALGILLIGLVIANHEKLAAFIHERLVIAVSGAHLDVRHMTAKLLPLRLSVSIDNRLPVGGIVETASFSVCINGRDVGAGHHVGKPVTIPASGRATVVFELEIDSDRTRRAVQGAILREAANLAHKMVDSLLAGRGHVKPSVVPMRVAGAVRVTVLSVPLIVPIDQTVDLLMSQ